MRSLIAAVFVLLSLVPSTEVASKAAVQIKVLPERPLIEQRDAARILNFDFLLQNSGTAPLHLNRIQVSLFDKSGNLAWQRELDENGHPSGMGTIEDRELKANSTIAIFNPFYEFGLDLEIFCSHMSRALWL